MDMAAEMYFVPRRRREQSEGEDAGEQAVSRHIK
jgi:hypothetical protein